MKYIKMTKTRAYIGIGHNWDLEQEEENYSDKEETSLVLKCNIRKMDLMWSFWGC